MIRTLSVALLLLSNFTAFAQNVANLPEYKKVAGIAGGSIKSVGSDTMNNLMSLWAEEFKKMYPSIKISVDGKGSSNALPALTDGQATFGPMSRDAKEAEVKEFKAKFGYEPILLPTSLDMLAVYVHKDNPIEGLSFPEIDAIFSSTRKKGAVKQAEVWSAFIPESDLAGQKIVCVGRNAASGTYGYFKEVALGGGDYGNWVGEQPGSAGVVNVIGNTKAAIGYSGIGFKSAQVKAIKLSEERGGELIAPDPENAYSGDYPLARSLYLAVNKDPRKPLDPMQAEFLKYVLSKQGQLQVIKDGYLPLPESMIAESREMLGL